MTVRNRGLKVADRPTSCMSNSTGWSSGSLKAPVRKTVPLIARGSIGRPRLRPRASGLLPLHRVLLCDHRASCNDTHHMPRFSVPRRPRVSRKLKRHSVSPMDDAQLGELVHRNLGDFVRFVTRLQGGPMLDADGVVAARGGPDHPATRQVVRTNTELAPDAWAARGRSVPDRTRPRRVRFHARSAPTTISVSRPARSPRVQGMVELARDGVYGAVAGTQAAAWVLRFGLSLAEDVMAYAVHGRRSVRALDDRPEDHPRDARTTRRAARRRLPDHRRELDGEPVVGALVVLFGSEPIGYVSWVSCTDAARWARPRRHGDSCRHQRSIRTRRRVAFTRSLAVR